jgi:predicted transposase/invertase (TIGR01784 family)
LICAIQNWPSDYITDLTYLNKDIIAQARDDKSSAVDLIVKIKDGSIIHIEIQVSYQSFYAQRALYYAARIYGSDLEKSAPYSALSPLISIHILVDNFFNDPDDALKTFSLREETSGLPFTPIFKIVFLELGKISRDNTLSEQIIAWGNFLMEPNETRRALAHQESFKEAYEELERLSADPALRYSYESYMKRIRDEKVKLIDAKVEGRAEGRAEGLAEGLAKGQAEGLAQGLAQGQAEGLAQGLAQGQAEIIKQLYQSGMSADTIASMLNRPLADIEALLRQ